MLASFIKYCYNNLLSFKMQKIAKSHHKLKIRNASKIVDNTVPYTVQNPINKSNKEFLVEGKFYYFKSFRKMH